MGKIKKTLMTLLTLSSMVTLTAPKQFDFLASDFSPDKSLDKLLIENTENNFILENDFNKTEKKHYELSDFPDFPYQDELPDILKFSESYGIDPVFLMAVRMAENGVDFVAYGIKPGGAWLNIYNRDYGYKTPDGVFHSYKDIKEKQLVWAAETLSLLMNLYESSDSKEDFASYVSKIWAPIGASNDPTGLNKNWLNNVKKNYNILHKKVNDLS